MFFKKHIPVQDSILADNMIKTLVIEWYRTELSLKDGVVGGLDTGLGRLLTFSVGSMSSEEGIDEFDKIVKNNASSLSRLCAYIPRMYAVVGKDVMQYTIDSINEGLINIYKFEKHGLIHDEYPLWILTYMVSCPAGI